MQLTTIRIDKPDATNFILGQTHFIKSVEDIHETLVAPARRPRFKLGDSRTLSVYFAEHPTTQFFAPYATPPLLAL